MSDNVDQNPAKNTNTSNLSAKWERETLEKILLEHITEQRRNRRWAIFFKLIMLFAFLAAIMIFYSVYTTDLSQPVLAASSHIAQIKITGEIGASESSNADNIHKALKNAFGSSHLKAVVLRIDSPGGSPVQSRQIYEEIRYYRGKYPKVKVYAVIEDIGTSAAYLIACGAEYIYADKTSLVGSIGAKIDSFGFVEAMQKLGIERRLYTAGKYKAILDPFSPRDSMVDSFVDTQLAQVHQEFINNVKQGRGNRLKETPDMFSGLFWNGEQALPMGLIDGYGDIYSLARDIIKEENIVDYSPSSSFLDQIANRVGTSMAAFIVKQLGVSVDKGVR